VSAVITASSGKKRRVIRMIKSKKGFRYFLKRTRMYSYYFTYYNNNLFGKIIRDYRKTQTATTFEYERVTIKKVYNFNNSHYNRHISDR